jgi:quercetin dioxygenase-like cupin family protein
VYGTGTWVWLPQGETMEHRATDEGDMVRIFIIDGALEIHYKNET